MSFYRGRVSAIGLGVLATAIVSSLTVLSTTSAAHAAELKTALPLVFEQNAGQSAQGTLFTGRAPNYSVEVRPTELRFAMGSKPAGRTIAIDFSGAQPGHAAGLDEALFRTNYYVGNDPKRWRTNVRNYQRIALRDLYPGIDAQFYSHDGEIEHDFLLAANADASQLSMRLSGARAVRLSGNGDLVLDAEEGALRLHKPQAYQVLGDGTRRTVAANFHLQRGKNETADLSFTLGQYDHRRPLVIDPVITYATYVAGSAGSTPAGIVADAAGNVYLTGTTSSPIASFGAAATSGTSDPAGGPTTAFVAKLATQAGGSQIAWLSYYGSGTGSASASAIAMNPAATTVFIGGSSAALDLPTSANPFNAAPATSDSTYGFVASFATASGQWGAGTYVDATTSFAGSTSVAALAATDVSVTIAGGTTGKDLLVTANALPVSSVVISSIAFAKGFVLTLDTTLSTESYGTYVAGDMGRKANGIHLSGAALDSAGNIYLAGSTDSDFPGAGTYGSSMYGPPTGFGSDHQNGFAAQLVPGAASTTIGYSYWTGGDFNDTVNGLILDANNNLYVFGSTNSDNVVSSATTTTSYSSNPAQLPPLQNSYPVGATLEGFFSKIDANGGLQVTSYIASSTPGSSSTVTGAAVDASGNLYFSGSTNGVKAQFPSEAGINQVNAPLLPAGPVPQDLTRDSTAPPFISRGYALQLAPSIVSVTGLAYTGPSNGVSYGVGFALDSAASPNAYILLQDVSSGGADYVTASAAQTAPQVSNGSTSSAYVARIAFAPSSPSSAAASIVAATSSYTPTTADYLSATQTTTETFTWPVTGAGAGATAVVFNLPYSLYLQPYTLGMLTLNGAALTADQCIVGTATVANTQPGITCVLPALASGTTDTFVLTDSISAAVATAVTASRTSAPIAASAFDAQGDSLDLTQNMAISGVPTFTLTNTVNGVLSASVNAALSTADTTTPNVAVTYTYTLTNTSTYDSPNTQLITNLSSSGATFTVTSTASSTGCDPTTATNGCDVPGGSTLVYTVSGVYLDAQFNTTTPGPYTSGTAAPSLSYAAVSNPPAVSGSPVSVAINVTPTITSVSPIGGPTIGGTIVTITGTHFSGAPASQFGSAAATGVSLVNAATITATTPSGAGTTNVGVTVGGKTVTLNNGFTYYAPQVYTVTTLTDDATGLATNCVNGVTTGDNCSLRDAIAVANALPSGVTGTIYFKGSLTSGATQANPAVYSTGTNGTLNITGNVTIQGPTSGSGNTLQNLIAVDGGQYNAQMFQVASTATAAINHLIVQNGLATGTYGGGIETFGALTLTADTITNNTAAAFGGGLCVYGGTAIVNGSTFSGNSAYGGGGIAVLGGALTLNNSTVSGNYATAQGQGVVVFRQYEGSTGTLTMNNSTVSGNIGGHSNLSVNSLGMSIIYPATVNLYNSIVAGNEYGDIRGTPSIISGSLINVSNPQLSPLGYYGGPTQTMAPLPGSPAICAASAASSNQAFTDQRGATHSAAYCTSSQLDAGAVQTSYSLGTVFTVQPPSVVAPGVAITPNPAVTVTENGMVFSGAPVTLSAASGTVGESTTAVSAASTGIAVFNNLTITGSQPGDDLIATLTLNTVAVPSAAVSLTSSSFSSLTLSAPAVLAGQAGVAYSQGVAPANGAGPYTYIVTSAGQLPAGLSLGPNSGVISGAPTAAGSFPVTVQVTDTTSAATASVGFTLAIAKGTATVTFTAATLTQTYTGSPLQAAAKILPSAIPTSELTYTYSGSGSTVYASSTTPPVHAGKYSVSISLADANYSASAQAVSFTITPLAVTVTAGSYSGAYDGSAHVPSACTSKYAGITCRNNPASVGPATGSGSITPVVGYGTGVAADFIVTPVNGSYTITKATALTWATPAAIAYGTTLSSTQLDATDAVAGRFVYTPSSGVLGVGSHVLSVLFTPTDTADATPASKSVTLIVNKASTTTTIAVYTRQTVLGTTAIIIPTVAPQVSGKATGTVAYTNGSTVLGSAPVGQPFTTPLLPLGPNSISASYSGDTNFNPSASAKATVTSVAPTLVKLMIPIANVPHPAPIAYTVIVPLNNKQAIYGTIMIYDGATLISTTSISTNGTSMGVTPGSLSPGVHSLRAVYGSDCLYPPGESPIVTVTIGNK